MKPYGFLAAIAAGVTLWGLPAIASDDVVLACVTSNPSSKDWVPETVLVKIQGGTLNAAVLDEYTLQVFEGGAIAQFSRPTANRIKLNWQLVDVKDSQDRPQTVNFKMSINSKTGRFNYSGLGESFFVTPGSAQGRCAPVE